MIEQNEMQMLSGFFFDFPEYDDGRMAVAALEINQETVACQRSCLLKPEHLDWIDKIGAILDDVAQ